MTAEMGRALVGWREREGLSRSAAARLLGVAHTTLRSWELDDVCPQPLQLQAVAAVLGRDVDSVRGMVGPDRVRTFRTSGGDGATPLCRARLAVGLTMTQVARRVGVVPSTVSRWENGVRTPPPQARPRLAAALRVSEEELARMLQSSPQRRSDGAVLPGLGQLRRDRGLTQKAFRMAVGIGATAASAYERGRMRVPAGRLAAVARVLDLDPETLLKLAAVPPRDRSGDRPLAALRRGAGMTRDELAHRLGVSVRTLAHWEAGTRSLPLAVVRPMARCLCQPLARVLAAAGLELPPVPPPRTWTVDVMPEILAALRASSGWSAPAVGRRVGVSGHTVRAWERGTSRPSASAGHRLELMYGLPPGSLVRLVHVDVGIGLRRAG